MKFRGFNNYWGSKYVHELHAKASFQGKKQRESRDLEFIELHFKISFLFFILSLSLLLLSFFFLSLWPPSCPLFSPSSSPPPFPSLLILTIIFLRDFYHINTSIWVFVLCGFRWQTSLSKLVLFDSECVRFRWDDVSGKCLEDVK